MFEYKGLQLNFHPLVYEPGEDTFLLAQHLANIALPPGAEALEIGTGTGLIALLLAKKAKTVVGTDINPHAINTARLNAETNDVKNATFLYSNLFENVKGKYDIIVFNAPYLPTAKESFHDPNLKIASKAWDGGKTGREVLEKFLEEAPKHLKENGKVVICESSLSKYSKTLEFLRSNKFSADVVAYHKVDFEEIVVIEAAHKQES